MGHLDSERMQESTIDLPKMQIVPPPRGHDA